MSPTWLLHPGSYGDLNWDDWHAGFTDCCEGKPKQSAIAEYHAGYFHSMGMADGYADTCPRYWSDKYYREGYLEASYERWCHSGEKSSWVWTQLNSYYCRFPRIISASRPWREKSYV